MAKVHDFLVLPALPTQLKDLELIAKKIANWKRFLSGSTVNFSGPVGAIQSNCWEWCRRTG
jgi:hypothetical protein